MIMNDLWPMICNRLWRSQHWALGVWVDRKAWCSLSDIGSPQSNFIGETSGVHFRTENRDKVLYLVADHALPSLSFSKDGCTHCWSYKLIHQYEMTAQIATIRQIRVSMSRSFLNACTKVGILGAMLLWVQCLLLVRLRCCGGKTLACFQIVKWAREGELDLIIRPQIQKKRHAIAHCTSGAILTCSHVSEELNLIAHISGYDQK